MITQELRPEIRDLVEDTRRLLTRLAVMPDAAPHAARLTAAVEKLVVEFGTAVTRAIVQRAKTTALEQGMSWLDLTFDLDNVLGFAPKQWVDRFWYFRLDIDGCDYDMNDMDDFFEVFEKDTIPVRVLFCPKLPFGDQRADIRLLAAGLPGETYDGSQIVASCLLDVKALLAEGRAPGASLEPVEQIVRTAAGFVEAIEKALSQKGADND